METIYLHFDTTVAQGNRMAEELQTFLSTNNNVALKRVKEKDNTQDAGAILAIVLGASSIVEIAKGIALWLQKKPGATLTLTKDKEKTEVIGTGLSSKDIEAILAGAEKLNK